MSTLALIGIGAGHTLTICAVGGLIILLNVAVPARVGLALEFAVGIALTVVGVFSGSHGPPALISSSSGWAPSRE